MRIVGPAMCVALAPASDGSSTAAMKSSRRRPSDVHTGGPDLPVPSTQLEPQLGRAADAWPRELHRAARRLDRPRLIAKT